MRTEEVEELNPISFADFMRQGRNKTDQWVMKNASNPEEIALRDALVQQEADRIRVRLKKDARFRELVLKELSQDISSNRPLPTDTQDRETVL